MTSRTPLEYALEKKKNRKEVGSLDTTAGKKSYAKGRFNSELTNDEHAALLDHVSFLEKNAPAVTGNVVIACSKELASTVLARAKMITETTADAWNLESESKDLSTTLLVFSVCIPHSLVDSKFYSKLSIMTGYYPFGQRARLFDALAAYLRLPTKTAIDAKETMGDAVGYQMATRRKGENGKWMQWIIAKEALFPKGLAAEWSASVNEGKNASEFRSYSFLASANPGSVFTARAITLANPDGTQKRTKKRGKKGKKDPSSDDAPTVADLTAGVAEAAKTAVAAVATVAAAADVAAVVAGGDGGEKKKKKKKRTKKPKAVKAVEATTASAAS